MPELAKRRVCWFTKTDLSIYQDDELLHKMRKAGCAQVLIGFESPTVEGLGSVALRKDCKRQRFDEYKRAIPRIRDHGITVKTYFVVGLDGHGPEVFDAFVDVVADALPWDVQMTVPTPFPGTPLYRQMQREGRSMEKRAWEKCTLFDINSQRKKLTAAKLRKRFHQLA